MMCMRVSVSQAAQLLALGKLVVFPTETVYGLGACADNPSAVEAIYIAKGRPRDNPLICHFYNTLEIERFGIVLSSVARTLFAACSPGPLSLLLTLPQSSSLAPATGGRESIICRIPNHPLALELLRIVDRPLAAPSANTSGRMSGTQIEMIEHDLQERVTGYIDGGEASIGIESTIVDARSVENIRILRPGVIGVTELTTVLRAALLRGEIESMPVILGRSEVDVDGQSTTPGARYGHYAPHTPLIAGSVREMISRKKDIPAYIATEEWLREAGCEVGSVPVLQEGIWYLTLGSRQDLSGIARRLYYTLYQLDQLKVKKACFVNEQWGSSSLGHALKDRIERILAVR